MVEFKRGEKKSLVLEKRNFSGAYWVILRDNMKKTHNKTKNFRGRDTIQQTLKRGTASWPVGHVRRSSDVTKNRLPFITERH